jgi:hypothetical protein
LKKLNKVFEDLKEQMKRCINTENAITLYKTEIKKFMLEKIKTGDISREFSREILKTFYSFVEKKEEKQDEFK